MLSREREGVFLVSMILEQYRGCFERIFVFSPSVEVDSAWQPVKDYIRDELGVNTDREQCWWEDWDEGALRKIIADQKRITQKSKELGLKKLYQVLIVLDDHADNPAVHRKTGDGVLDTLFIRGRHFCINTWVSTQKLRLMSSAVRVNVMFYCVFRLWNQLELDALVEELSAMLPKETLYSMYQEATREPYSFCFVNLRAPKEDMFWVRFDRKFVLNGDDPEHHHFLEILAGTYDSKLRNMRIRDNLYGNNQFIAAFPVECVPRHPLSGLSTRSGDLCRFSFSNMEADRVDQCFVHMISYQLVTLSGAGVSSLDQ